MKERAESVVKHRCLCMKLQEGEKAEIVRVDAMQLPSHLILTFRVFGPCLVR